MPFISRPATGCCCWLAGPSVSSECLHLRGSEIHQQQKRRDPGSTFFRALRPTSSLKSNPPCAPSSSTSGVHKTSQAFLTALGSDGGTRCTQFRTSHTGEKTQKVTWTDHAKSPATAFCQRIPKDLLQRCFSGWSPEISYNISDRFIKRGEGQGEMMEDNESAILARWSDSNSITTTRTNGFGPNGRHSSRLCDYYFGSPPGGH